ncbi:MAG TPA: exonuclease SbcCD subunit D [Phototrophicaceae bacterium]|nr:exonuclease SbcCD subunit D [Phototrophicaceae bacterium]
MSDPIRVLHFADVHIGMENYGRTDPETGLSSRVRDFLRRMDEMIEFAKANDVDLTIFAGDAFKTRSPNPTYQREFAWRVRDLIALAPLVMLVGNHDLPPTMLKASSIEIYDTLAIPNVWVADQYEVRRITTKRGDVAVGAAPYPLRSRVLDGVNTAGMTIAETDNLLQRELTALLDQLAADADQMGDIPRILTGHLTVSGAVWGSERGIMLGRDVQVLPSALADERWDYVALGHIHKHQNLTSGRKDVPPVVYSGSLERIDFGEENDPKGFCWVELERKQTEWKFQRLKARPFVTIHVDLRQSEDPTREAVDEIEEYDLQGAVVRVVLDLTPETEALLNINMVEDALKRGIGKDGYIAGIRREVEQPTRARLGGSPEGLTDDQLLERYLMSKGIDETRRAELLAAAGDILEGGAVTAAE